MTERHKPLIYLLILLGIGINALAIYTWDLSIVGNDGVQYLSTAKNWLAGNGFTTDALIYAPHFQGILPAPQTVWPTGYSVAIAFLSKLGIELVHAALILNLVSHLLAGVLMSLILIRMGVTRLFATVCGLLFYLMAMPWFFTTELLTEPVFTALLLAATWFLPSTNKEGVRNWLICGVLIALAIYIRYSALFFAIGVGTGVFICLLLHHKKEQPQKLIRDVSKLALLLLTPVTIFLYFMYNTVMVVGTLDRFSGHRDPQTLEWTLREWLVATSKLLGFNSGPLVGGGVALFLFLAFTLILVVLAAKFFSRKLHRENHAVSNDSLRYFNLVLIIVAIHTITFAAYLSINALSTSPLEIRTRYLYQFYPGIFSVFCFIIYSFMHKGSRHYSKQKHMATTAIIAALIGIYLFAQINQMFTIRKPYFREAKATAAMMQMKVSDNTNLNTLIQNCFKDQTNATVWSTHGQHIHLHSGVSTVTHADIYVNETFAPTQMLERINDYNIKMFVFIDFYPDYTSKQYKDYMYSVKHWVSKQPAYKQVSFQNEGTGEIKTVTAYTSCDLPKN